MRESAFTAARGMRATMGTGKKAGAGAHTHSVIGHSPQPATDVLSGLQLETGQVRHLCPVPHARCSTRRGATLQVSFRGPQHGPGSLCAVLDGLAGYPAVKNLQCWGCSIGDEVRCPG